MLMEDLLRYLHNHATKVSAVPQSVASPLITGELSG